MIKFIFNDFEVNTVLLGNFKDIFQYFVQKKEFSFHIYNGIKLP
jgi:hypothetical protein